MSPCSKNLDTQEDYWDKIGTFWNIDYIGSRHAVSPKLGLSGPRTDINSFLPILNRSEQFEENVHFRSFLVIPGHSIGHFIRHLMAPRPSLRLYQS